jgi:dihydrofolate reductase
LGVVVLTIIAAIARNGAIGKGGQLPWHYPEDLARFKALTMGHAVVMGRKTWESIPAKFRPLPGRTSIVMSRGAEVAGAHYTAPSLHTAMLEAGLSGAPIDIIGGASVYAAALPLADRLEITEVDVDVEGADAFFPLGHKGHVSLSSQFGDTYWHHGDAVFHERDRRRGETPGLTFVTWERVR